MSALLEARGVRRQFTRGGLLGRTHLRAGDDGNRALRDGGREDVHG